MSKNTQVIPFTEIVERTSELSSIRQEVASKVRGIINDIYVRDIPKKEDWSFMMKTTSLTLLAEYAVGTVSANTGGTALTFSIDATITSSMTARKIKMSGNDYIYDFTFGGTTSGTIAPVLSGNQNVTSQSYSIFQPFYSLVNDFDRFPYDGGMHTFSGGSKKNIPEIGYKNYIANFRYTPNDSTENCRVVDTDTAGNRRVEIIPPSKTDRSVEYDYIHTLTPMRETTAGLVGNISASGTTVTGDSNTQFSLAQVGDYFRIDNFGRGSDSEWYRVLAINGNSSMTLATAFGLSGATSANYTICTAPDMPSMMHPAILYGSLAQLTAIQDDPMALAYKQEYANVLTDGKRIYKTRVYSQEVRHIGEDYMYRR